MDVRLDAHGEEMADEVIEETPQVFHLQEHLAHVLSFLHAFLLVGPVAACSRFSANACRHELLCEAAVARDLAQEGAEPVPGSRAEPQQLRPRLPTGREALLTLARALRGCPPQRAAQLAVQDGRPQLLRWAARQGADLSNLDGSGQSALRLAAVGNKPHTLVAAADFCDIEQEHADFGTAMHAAAYAGAAAALEALYRLGADLEARNRSFLQTPLLVACSRNKAAAVVVLLAAGADAASVDCDGLNALRMAVGMRSLDAEREVRRHLNQA